ncbi:MAG TPA: cell division protein ZapB [Thermoanaerobaculia bacterium]|jgi:FtsZ-binding cell division protein ZapB|nr:cell division protein ZapB [Thermoanaerobaculia bacterium]
MKKTRENETMTLAGTEEAEILGRLSERVEKAVATIQELRKERDQLRARVAELEAGEETQDRLKRERDEIRNRIESILSNLEELESAE